MKTNAREVVYSTAMPLLRWAGKVLSLPVLWVLLWPWMLLVAVRKWRLLRHFMKADGPAQVLLGGRRARFVAFIMKSVQLGFSRMLFLWPEKLKGRESKRFRCEEAGLRLDQIIEKPTVLVTLHVGPMTILVEWLRANGFPVAIVSLRPLHEMAKYRQELGRLRDRQAGLEGIPPVIATGQTWEMHDHLLKHKLLIVAVEAEQLGRHIRTAECDGVAMTMSTGILQLAGMVGARILPCTIRSGPFFAITMRIGPMLEGADLSSRAGISQAADALWQTLKPAAMNGRYEWDWALLESIRLGSEEMQKQPHPAKP